MRPATDRPASDAATQVRRWGPLVLILAALLAVAVLVVVDDPEGGAAGDARTVGSSAVGTEEDGDAAAGDAAVGAPEPVGRMPVTYAEAVEAGTADELDWGDRCDPDTGRVALPTVYAVPCVPVFSGDNGGATHRGVTADTVRVVRYRATGSADLASLLTGAGLEDTPEAQLATLQGYARIYTSRSETYGRRLEIVEYAGTGAGDDEVAARADAVTIAEELQPFAVVGGPGLDRGAFAEELAARQILCVGCAGAAPDRLVQENAPYLWDAAPSADQFLQTLGAWLDQAGDDVAATAEFAGDPAVRASPRKVGVIHFEQDPPIFEGTADEQAAEGEDYALRETYLFNLATMPEKAADLVARLKAEQITTVLFLGDPIMPIYLTRSATEQGYFPEWVFTGTALTDTNVMARQYDQQQMTHAFGLSNLGAPTPQALQTSWRLWPWYFGAGSEPPALAQYGLLEPPAELLAAGIHMAGPDLTPETFSRGLFRLPPAGGGPTTPQVSWGAWGFFDAPDHQGIDDSVEIWWDAAAVGEDEIGRTGTGMWRRARGAERFTAVDAPAPAPFVVEGSVTSFDVLPPEDTPPDYPPPPGSPAAGP
ncbi:MAG: hypothetical protein IPM45_03305 [Acidimicrobiales bacterium]|nr:hypothetical protein [Acidimicrobiales bacterium]